MAIGSVASADQSSNSRNGLLWLFLPVLALSLVNAEPGLSRWAMGVLGVQAWSGEQTKAVQAAALARSIAAAQAKLCLTQAVYYEARGERLEGQEAVAQVVLNRVRDRKFPKTVCGVVFQGAARGHGCQFSFACDGSMERDVAGDAWRRAEAVASRALGGFVFAPVASATHYHTRAVSPYWSAHMTRVGAIGAHVFYNHTSQSSKAQSV